MSESTPVNPLLTKPREETVRIYDPAAAAELEELREQMVEAEFSGTGKRMSSSPAMQLAKKHDERQAKAEEEALVVVLHAPGSRKLRQLQEEHPPRADSEIDQLMGVSYATYPEALVRAEMVSPVVTDAQFEEWVETCPAGEWAKVVAAANRLANEAVELPKFSAVSMLPRIRESEMKQLDATA